MAIVVAMCGVNIAGSGFVARAQTVVVYVVVGILAVFAVVLLANINFSLLAPAGYPPLRQIVSSVALTFFAFLGFGIVTFTAKDLRQPARELPHAMYQAIGIAAVFYPGIALGAAGYWLMTVTGLFATAGATNGGLYPAAGLCEQLASTHQFPPIMGHKVAVRAPMGLVVSAGVRFCSPSCLVSAPSHRSGVRRRSSSFCS